VFILQNLYSNKTGVKYLFIRHIGSDALQSQTLSFLIQVNKEEEGANLEEPGLNMEFVYAVHDTLREMVS
jgi:hypothetical protein